MYSWVGNASSDSSTSTTLRKYFDDDVMYLAKFLLSLPLQFFRTISFGLINSISICYFIVIFF